MFIYIINMFNMNVVLFVGLLMAPFMEAIELRSEVECASCGSPHKGRFDKWISDFKMRFRDNGHYECTFKKWVDNDKYIEKVNAKNMTYTLGHNHLSGMDSQDYSKYVNGFALGDYITNIDSDLQPLNRIHMKDALEEIKCISSCVHEYDKDHKFKSLDCVNSCVQEEHRDEYSLGFKSVPDSIDWVSNGAVTPVKNQGQCGSCWSFSTTGALEGAYYVTYGSLPSFSEQELVDCDNRSGGGKDHGCNGGLMDNAFSWIEKNGGLCSEDSYPYTSGTTQTAGNCEETCSNIANSKVSGYIDVKKSSDDAMMDALSQQPVAIAIQADQKDFQLYKSGVFTGDCGTQLDHGVLVVGYGTQDGDDYYRVKNSWGTTWGDQGYIYLGRGSEFNKGQGQCGMLLQASYPLF
jgi:C1A family cysteine protease